MASASQIELTSMLDDPSHRSQHMPNDYCASSEKGDDDEEVIGSVFSHEFRKIMWYSRPSKEFEQIRSVNYADPHTNLEVTRTVYKVSPGMDYLIGNEIRIRLPWIRALEGLEGKVKFAWTPNVGVNSILQAKFTIGDLDVNVLDTGAIDDWMKWAVPLEQSELRDASIGNTPEMTTWNHEYIPSKTCIFSIPFFYTYSLKSAFPLFLLFGSQTTIEHSLVTWQSPISKLLRVKVRKNEHTPWKNCPPESFCDFIEHEKYQTPVFEGDYGIVLDDEKNELRKYGTIGIQLHSFITFTSQNSANLNSTDTFKLKTEDPVIAMFWKCVNEDAETTNNRTNYTTNPDDLYKGNSPLSLSVLKYGETTKFRTQPEQMKSIVQLKRFENVPRVNGYNAYAFSCRPFSTQGHTGVIFNSDPAVELTCNLTDTNVRRTKVSATQPRKSPDEVFSSLFGDDDDSSASSSSSPPLLMSDGQNAPNKCKYRIEVRLLLWRELQFELKKGVYVVSFA